MNAKKIFNILNKLTAKDIKKFAGLFDLNLTRYNTKKRQIAGIIVVFSQHSGLDYYQSKTFVNSFF